MTPLDTLLLIAEITALLYLFHRLIDETLSTWVQWRDDQGGPQAAEAHDWGDGSDF